MIIPSSNYVRHLSPTALIKPHGLSAGGDRAFSFFLESAGPALQGELDRAFWGESVVQMCHGSLTLQKAVLALSILCENPLENPLQWPTNVAVNFPRPVQRQAFRWYGQSLHGLSDVFGRAEDHGTLALALTSCIVVACIEIQQLNVVNSMMLMRCGYNLLSQKGAADLASHSTLIRDTILPIFIQQTIVLSLHGYHLPDGWLPALYTEPYENFTSIISFKDARTQLHLIMLNPTLALEHSQTALSPEKRAELEKMQRVVLNKLQEWHYRFDRFLTTLVAFEPSQTRAISLLWTHYFVAVIWSSTYTDFSEMAYDNHLPRFVAILDYIQAYISSRAADSSAATYTYSFETRIIPSLYFVGWRCRDPQVRRRALQLMRRAPAQENLFHRDVQIWALRRIIQIEEGWQANDDDAVEAGTVNRSMPSEADRLRHVVVRWNTSGGDSAPYLVYSQWPLQEDKDGQLRPLVPPSIRLDDETRQL